MNDDYRLSHRAPGPEGDGTTRCFRPTWDSTQSVTVRCTRRQSTRCVGHPAGRMPACGSGALSPKA